MCACRGKVQARCVSMRSSAKIAGHRPFLQCSDAPFFLVPVRLQVNGRSFLVSVYIYIFLSIIIANFFLTSIKT